MPKPLVFVPGLPGTELHLEKADGSLGKKVFLPRPILRLLNPSAKLKGRLKGPANLAMNGGVVAGDPIGRAKFLGFDLMKQADSLYAILKECGVQGANLRKVGWDWRLPVTHQATLPSHPTY